MSKVTELTKLFNQQLSDEENLRSGLLNRTKSLKVHKISSTNLRKNTNASFRYTEENKNFETQSKKLFEENKKIVETLQKQNTTANLSANKKINGNGRKSAASLPSPDVNNLYGNLPELKDQQVNISPPITKHGNIEEEEIYENLKEQEIYENSNQINVHQFKKGRIYESKIENKLQTSDYKPDSLENSNQEFSSVPNKFFPGKLPDYKRQFPATNDPNFQIENYENILPKTPVLPSKNIFAKTTQNRELREEDLSTFQHETNFTKMERIRNKLETKLLKSPHVNTPSTDYIYAEAASSYEDNDEKYYSVPDERYHGDEPLENYENFQTNDFNSSTRSYTSIINSSNRASSFSEISDWESDTEYEPINTLERVENPQVFFEATKNKKFYPTLKSILQKNNYNIISWKNAVQCVLLQEIDNFSAPEIRLYETKFLLVLYELIHLNNMNILNNHFASKLVIVLSKSDFNTLFGLVPLLQNNSAILVEAFESCWKDDICLNGLSHILYKYVMKYLDVYKKYFGNLVQIIDVYEFLLRNRQDFSDMLLTIENDPESRKTPLRIYFIDPVNKIESLSKILENLLKLMTIPDPEYKMFQKTKSLIDESLTECKRYENECKETLLKSKIEKILEFPKNTEPLSLTKSVFRNLIKIGGAEQIEINNSLFGRGKVIRKPIHLFLFNDVLIITRRTGEQKFSVLQYCYRINLSLVQDVALPIAYHSINSNTLFILSIMENNENKRAELLICCKSPGDKQSWCEVLDPSEIANNNRKNNFENFQVIVTQIFKARQTDQLSIQLRETLDVFIDTEDGWYFGRRITDGSSGWFPVDRVMRTIKSFPSPKKC